MRDARDLRAQAELFLEIAAQMSDRKAAERFRSDAARYQAEAAALEEGAASRPEPKSQS